MFSWWNKTFVVTLIYNKTMPIFNATENKVMYSNAAFFFTLENSICYFGNVLLTG